MSWTCTVVSSEDATDRTAGGFDGEDTANLRATRVCTSALTGTC